MPPPAYSSENPTLEDIRGNSKAARQRRRQLKADAQNQKEEAEGAAAATAQADLEAQQPDDGTIFPNYSYSPQRPFVGGALFFSNTMTVIFLGVLVFISPDRMKGGTAALKSGEEYVGVLRKCQGTTCDPWMSGGSDDGGFDYADMYLTLGLAALSSLWFAIFIWFFNIYRMVTSSPIAASTAISQGIKRFIYRATRAFLMVNVIMIPSLIIDVLVKGVKYRSAKGVTGFGIIGGGVALLFFAFLFTFLSTMIELRHPGGKTHRIVGWFNFCAPLGFCVSEAGVGESVRKKEDIEMQETKASGL